MKEVLEREAENSLHGFLDQRVRGLFTERNRVMLEKDLRDNLSYNKVSWLIKPMQNRKGLISSASSGTNPCATINGICLANHGRQQPKKQQQ